MKKKKPVNLTREQIQELIDAPGYGSAKNLLAQGFPKLKKFRVLYQKILTHKIYIEAENRWDAELKAGNYLKENAITFADDETTIKRFVTEECQ